MTGYTKLFQSIVTSSIWQESKETKIVWITMLALSDQHGYVNASIPGLAKVSGVTIDECENALKILLSPDPYSRSQDFEGRRIDVADGGWFVLNRDKYRDKESEDERREYRKNWMRQRRASVNSPVNTCEQSVNTCEHRQRQRQSQRHSQRQSTKKKKADAILPFGNSVTETLHGVTSSLQSVTSASGGEIPHVLQTPAFQEAWKEWETYRKERRQKLTKTTVARQLKKLASWGEAKAIQAIETAIEKGWQGLFEPKEYAQQSNVQVAW